MLECAHSQSNRIIAKDVGDIFPCQQSGIPQHMHLPTSFRSGILTMADEAVDDEEPIGVLVLITPLQHLVVCHDLLKALIPNAAFETDDGLKELEIHICSVDDF